MSSANTQLVDQFLEDVWLSEGLSQNTLIAYRTDLSHYIRFLNGCSPWQISFEFLQSFIAERSAGAYTARSNARLISSLRKFYQWGVDRQELAENPAHRLVLPKSMKRLPGILNEEDVEKLLNAPDLNTDIGVRDKAMLELLYATGLRVSELVGLDLSDVNLRQGVVRVMGKGAKERLVPAGEYALEYLILYIKTARDRRLYDHKFHKLFISHHQKGITRQSFWHRIKYYTRIAGIEKTVSPHPLRHRF